MIQRRRKRKFLEFRRILKFQLWKSLATIRKKSTNRLLITQKKSIKSFEDKVTALQLILYFHCPNILNLCCNWVINNEVSAG